MGRWKTVIGPKLKARTFENQKTEAKVGVRILNQMTGLGRLALPASSKFYLSGPQRPLDIGKNLDHCRPTNIFT